MQRIGRGTESIITFEVTFNDQDFDIRTVSSATVEIRQGKNKVATLMGRFNHDTRTITARLNEHGEKAGQYSAIAILNLNHGGWQYCERATPFEITAGL
jgi:hypothetical protein